MAKKTAVDVNPAALDGGALTWDGPLSVSGDRLAKTLAEGPARFEVVSFARGRFAGSEKLSACPRADLGLEVTDREGNTAIVSVGLPLHEKMLWKLVQFAKSAQLIDADLGEGEMFSMPWHDIVGAKGVCEIEHRTWMGDDGKERTATNVKRFLYGDEALLADGEQD